MLTRLDASLHFSLIYKRKAGFQRKPYSSKVLHGIYDKSRACSLTTANCSTSRLHARNERSAEIAQKPRMQLKSQFLSAALHIWAIDKSLTCKRLTCSRPQATRDGRLQIRPTVLQVLRAVYDRHALLISKYEILSAVDYSMLVHRIRACVSSATQGCKLLIQFASPAKAQQKICEGKAVDRVPLISVAAAI